MMINKKIYYSWWLLRITYGLLFILVGIDKFFNILTDWHQFIGFDISSFVLLSREWLLRFFGIVQILAGILLLSPLFNLGLYLIGILLLFIFFNLLFAPSGFLVIIHDISMIVGIIVLWQITSVIKKEKTMQEALAHQKIANSWLLLKITYGLLFIIAGADKFTNLITHWQQYVSPYVLDMIPVSAHQLLLGVGIWEIILGILILAIATRTGAYLATAWLLIIVVDLLSMGTFFDIAVRDTVMAVGSFVLAWLTEVYEGHVRK